MTSSLKLPRNGAVGFIDWLGCIVFMTPEGRARQIKSDQRRTEKRFFAHGVLRPRNDLRRRDGKTGSLEESAELGGTHLRAFGTFGLEPSQQGTHTDRALFAQCILVDPAVLHDDEEVLFRIFDQLDVRDRVAVDEQEVGERAFLDHAELPRVRIALPGQQQQLGVGPGRHHERFAGGVPANELGQEFPLTLRQLRENRMSVPHAVLILYFFASVNVLSVPAKTSIALARSNEPGGKASASSSGNA